MRRKLLNTILLLAVAALVWFYKPAAPIAEDYSTTVILEELDYPWAIAPLSGDSLLLTLRSGSLLKVNLKDNSQQTISGLPEIKVGGQGGLLGVTIDPDFENNQQVYLCYSAENDDGHTGSEIIRARLQGQQLKSTKVIFKAKPKTRGKNHYGCRLKFGPDGYLYATLGEKFSFRDKAQELDNHLGKIIRIKKDGSIPEDNPFAKSSAPEIYSYGHRNPQGLAFRQDGTLWALEHGPRGGDELNLIEPGLNYGWPKTSYGKNYTGTKVSDYTSLPGIVEPVVYWVPSIAPADLIFYQGDKYPEFKNTALVAVMKHQHLRVLNFEGNKVTGQKELLKHLDSRFRDVKQGSDGYIYLVTDSSNGQLLRLEPKTKR